MPVAANTGCFAVVGSWVVALGMVAEFGDVAVALGSFDHREFKFN